MKRYAVVGWSARFKRWETDMVEARSKVTAKEKFVCLYPNLKRVKIYEMA
jgi:hypothetical protein